MTFEIRDQNIHLRRYLGRYLKQRRLGLRLDQKTVAQQLTLSESQYRSIEAGKAKVSDATLEGLFAVLGLDEGELYEIVSISKVAHANAIAKELSGNFPK